MIVVPNVPLKQFTQGAIGGKHDAARRLRFERMKEAFHGRVILGAPLVRTLEDAEVPQSVPELLREILGSTITVND